MTSPKFGGSLSLEKKFPISPSGKPECEFICFILYLHLIGTDANWHELLGDAFDAIHDSLTTHYLCGLFAHEH